MITLLKCITLLMLVQYSSSIKVCSTNWEYYKFSGDCWENPDGKSKSTEILRRWGATVTENYLTTDDGYIILLISAVFNKTQETPIVFGHGQHHNADSFITNYNKSLPYNLLKLGYEVYLINYRASRYSRGHVNLSFHDEAYWKFDFHEMAVYDLRKCLTFINEKTNQKAIYIGYSLGCGISYVYSSVYNIEAPKYLKGIISLGPFATMTNVRTVFRHLVGIWPKLRPIFKILFGNYFPRSEALVDFWAPTPIRWYLWDLIERVVIIGPDFGHIDPVYKPIQTLLFDDAIPIGVFDHYSTIGVAKDFVQTDHGKEKNMQLYGTETPPIYNLSNIDVPVAMFVGKSDYFGDPADAINLYKNMTKAQCGYTVIKRDTWNHSAFIWASDIVPLLVEEVLKKIKNIENNTC